MLFRALEGEANAFVELGTVVDLLRQLPAQKISSLTIPFLTYVRDGKVAYPTQTAEWSVPNALDSVKELVTLPPHVIADAIPLIPQSEPRRVLSEWETIGSFVSRYHTPPPTAHSSTIHIPISFPRGSAAVPVPTLCHVISSQLATGDVNEALDLFDRGSNLLMHFAQDPALMFPLRAL